MTEITLEVRELAEKIVKNQHHACTIDVIARIITDAGTFTPKPESTQGEKVAKGWVGAYRRSLGADKRGDFALMEQSLSCVIDAERAMAAAEMRDRCAREAEQSGAPINTANRIRSLDATPTK